jgi:hypothetical protein
MFGLTDTFLLACAMPTLPTAKKPMKTKGFVFYVPRRICRLESFGTTKCANAHFALARLAQMAASADGRLKCGRRGENSSRRFAFGKWN